ncbi:DinB family protein [Terriglobus tenax]|uniref:DinB family protein n=1 Tax=Terriglobus tenax TaxID=1111115 RepID=UPI0021DF5EB4|nr:DinB family protein [Terriglobus tenax]
MRIAQVLLADYDAEVRSTQRLFERLPAADKATWKPHEKSMELGKLAMHVAALPGFGAMILSTQTLDTGQQRPPSFPYEGATQAAAIFSETSAKTRSILEAISDEEMEQPWQLQFHDRVFFKGSRILAYRTMFFNHLVHHRAQLGVYLRLLNIPIPGLYGPSADEPINLG